VWIKDINPPGDERGMAAYAVKVLRRAGIGNDGPANADEAKGSA
jgi:hypothetical protein